MSEDAPQQVACVESGASARDVNPEMIPFVLRRGPDAPPIGDELAALATFREAAKQLKTAEAAFRAAQVAYGEAIKRLSDEATK